MNIKTIIVLFILGFLASCSTTPLTEEEREQLRINRMQSAEAASSRR